jgi:nucleotide-binding universal stress UspA family protein
MLVVYLAFLAIPLGDLFHVVVSFTEVLFLFFEDGIPLYGAQISLYSGIVGFVMPVLLGNTIGGVVLVTLVNYFQTSEERLEEARFEGVSRRLTVPEWVFGRAAGRSYVPILDATEATLFAGEGYRIMVPITNPRTDGPIVELAARLASDHEDGVVHIVHVVQAPERMSLSSGDAGRRIADVSAEGMANLRSTAAEHEVEVSTSTVVSHRSFEEVFNMARRTRPDAVLMGWGDDQLWSAARAERPIDELTNQLPCDFLILNEHELDTSRILIPTSGGPDSDLSAEVAKVLADTAGADVTLLHVVDGPENRGRGESFLANWAADHGLEDAELVVDDAGDVEDGICRAAGDKTLVIIGATEKGLLSRLVSNSLHLDVIHDVDASVLLTERPSSRSLRERLFGSGRRATDMSAGVERDPERSEGTDVRDADRREPDRDGTADADGGSGAEPDAADEAVDAVLDEDAAATDETAGSAGADEGGPGADDDAPEDEQPHLDDTFIADHDDADEEAAAEADAEDAERDDDDEAGGDGR